MKNSVVKIIFLVLFLNSLFCISQKTEKSFLYLQNQRTDKIKKINLTRSKFISYSTALVSNNSYTYLTFDSYNPSTCIFGETEIEFHTEEINYTSWKQEENIVYDDNWNMLKIDSTIHLPYYDSSIDVDINLSRQSKIGAVLYGIGCGFVYASLVNAFFVAPMRGLNAGGFSGYNTKRLWQGEFYSGIGLSVGIPLMLIFDYKDYYFQSARDEYDTWIVVDGKL